MNISARTPTNTNFLQPNRFKLVFPKVPNLEYFCQSIDLPEISMEPVEHANPFNKLFITSVNTIFDPLEVDVIVDEDLRAWQEIHDWLTGSSFPRNFLEYAVAKEKGLYSEMGLISLNNANNPIINFTFHHCFPIRLGKLRLTSSDTGTESQLTVPVTFRYDDYEIRRMKD